MSNPVSLFRGLNAQKPSNVGLTDIVAPTFSGISGLVANANGSLTASWAAASDATLPIRYRIYIQAATASGLFSDTNMLPVGSSFTSATIFALRDGTLLQNGVTYFVGVRAVDGVGNVDTNVITRSVASQGVPDNSLDAKLNLILAKTNNLPTDPASNTVVNTRLAASGYTAPDNTGIAAIKAKTDQLIFTSGNLNAIAQVVADKTGYALTSAEREAIATIVESHLLNEGDGQMLINAIVSAIGNQNVDQIALVAAIRADLERAGGSIATRAAQTTADAIKAKTDALPSDPASNTQVNTRLAASGYTTPPTVVQIRTEMDQNSTKLAHLDQDISSRASQASLDADFGNTSALVENLQSTGSALQTTANDIAATETGFADTEAALETTAQKIDDAANLIAASVL